MNSQRKECLPYQVLCEVREKESVGFCIVEDIDDMSKQS